MSRAVKFKGTPPRVHEGTIIEIRDANREWWPATAMSKPRYDFENAIGGRCYLTVAVDTDSLLAVYGHAVNWPAGAVRLPPGTETDHG